MPESVRSKLSDLVRGRAPEAKNTSVNYEIGQGWLKKKKKNVGSPWAKCPTHIGDLSAMQLNLQDSRLPTSKLMFQRQALGVLLEATPMHVL